LTTPIGDAVPCVTGRFSLKQDDATIKSRNLGYFLHRIEKYCDS